MNICMNAMKPCNKLRQKDRQTDRQTDTIKFIVSLLHNAPWSVKTVTVRTCTGKNTTPQLLTLPRCTSSFFRQTFAHLSILWTSPYWLVPPCWDFILKCYTTLSLKRNSPWIHWFPLWPRSRSCDLGRVVLYHENLKILMHLHKFCIESQNMPPNWWQSDKVGGGISEGS